MGWSRYSALALLQKEIPSRSGRLLIVSATLIYSSCPNLLELGDVGHVVVPSLPLLLLQLDRDAAHGAPLQPLHQVGDKPGNLIVISALAFHPGISSLRTRGFSS